MPTKNQKELLEFLGPEYFIKTIDGEPCIYRKLNPHYDIEISCTRVNSPHLSVFVWDVSRGEWPFAEIVERTFDIPDKFTLQQLLNGYADKYGDLTSPNAKSE